MQKDQVNEHATHDTFGTPSIREKKIRERDNRIILIKIPARERNVDVCHPGTGMLLLMLALAISLASRSRGPRRWNNFNNKRQSPSQKAAASLVSLPTCPLRVRAFTRRKTFQSFSVTTENGAPASPLFSSFALVAHLLSTRE